MRFSYRFFALAPIAAILMIGCAPTAPKESAPIVLKTKVMKPTLTPLAETKPTQEKGGLTIVVEPVLYEIKTDSIVTDRPRNPDLLEPILEDKGAYYFQRTVRSTVEMVPDQLVFNVRLINGLSHVVRGAGAVVSAVVNGQQVGFQQEGYADFINAVVIPRGEVSVKIWGPKLSTLPDSCTFGLFFYDFVTATDAAGNPSERQNFEWYYNYVTVPEYVDGFTHSAKMVRDTKGEHRQK